MNALALITFACTASAAPTASITFARSYGDSMVLQSAPKRANVWGFVGAPSSAVGASVSVGVAGATPVVGTVVPFNDTHMTWRATLPATPATPVREVDGVFTAPGGTTLTATLRMPNTAAVTVSLADVQFGEVWVCSGQSNMAFLVQNAFNGAAEVQKANNFPAIRMMTTKKTAQKTAQHELAEVEQVWSVSSNVSISQDSKGANDDNWLYMSAMCYFYAQRVFEGLGSMTPIGLVNTNWGGTDIESWSSPEALAKCPHGKSDGSVRYNAMISPLLNMTIAGAIWYQGEANSGAPALYGCQLPAMIADWRAKWAVGTGGATDALFPFGFVQLAAWVEGGSTSMDIAQTRWYMTAGRNNVPNALMPNVFMGTAFDLGDSKSPFGSVHPRYKQEAASRLATAGLAVAYGQQDVYFQGPVPASARRAGSGAVDVTFSGCGAEGIVADQVNTSSTVEEQPAWSGENHFEVCIAVDAAQCDLASYDAKLWVEAKAAVGAGRNGADACTVALTFAATAQPVVGVRFAWRAYPCEKLGCSVYAKKEQLPPAPFFLNVTA